jgi:4-aminobutyrate aminotransferase-like enzyme/Ser/Thr protein kinase RdoA (MazF antagonist)
LAGTATGRGADPLGAPPPQFDAEQVERLAGEVFGLAGSLTPLASERDLNFRLDDGQGQSYLLKLQNPAEDPAVVDMQTRALLHVARTDPSLPVMRVIPGLDGRTVVEAPGSDGRVSLVRLFTFLEGHNPVAEELGDRALYAWGATVARLARALRGFFHPGGGYAIRWDIARASNLRPLLVHVRDDGQRTAVERILDRFAANVAPILPGLRAQVLHNDMSLDNVLVDDDGRVTGITDFGDMTHTALVCDLAVALSDVLDGREDALDMAGHLIAGYESLTPLEETESALLGDLVAARCAAAMVISAWRLELYPENAAYVSTFGLGAWRFLRLLEAQGFDEVGRRLREACGRGGLPYRPAATQDLARRRAILGRAPLAYLRPVHLVRGEGVWLFDPQGRRYLDAYNNVPVAGHAHPRVAAAVAAQIRRVSTNTRYLHEAVVELAERLLATMPAEAGFDRVLFVNSGSEANDIAWRMARCATRRRGAIVSSFAYHGITESIMDLSPEEWPPGYLPSHVERVIAPDRYRALDRRDEEGSAGRYTRNVEEAAVALAERNTPLAAMIADPAFTSDGVLCPPGDYLRAAADAVRAAGGLLIADEVQAGYGRLGESMWSFQASAIAPDLVTMGKPMGNGFPVAAVVTRSDLVDGFADRTGFFSTFGGNPVACAAALAVLEVVQQEGLVSNARETGAHLREGLTNLLRDHALVGDVRGRGLMIGVELVKDRSTREPAGREAVAVVNALREASILIGATGPGENVLKIRPPLVFGPDHADLLVETLDRVLSSVDGSPGGRRITGV